MIGIAATRILGKLIAPSRETNKRLDSRYLRMLGICAVPVIEIEGVIMDLEDVDLLANMDRKKYSVFKNL